MNDLELLAKLQGIPLAELAEKIGTDRGNLRSGLQGKRPIPEDTKRKLFNELGVTDDGRRLKTKHVHVWHIVPTGVRLKNVDEMIEALKRLTSERYIGPTWYSTSGSEKFQISVMLCTGETGDYFVDPRGQEFTDYDHVLICLVQRTDDAIEINPNLLSRGKTDHGLWIETLYQPEEIERIPKDQIIPAFMFQKIIARRATYNELNKLLTMPEHWTWDRLIYFAGQSMSPAEAAEKLGLDTVPPKLEY